MIHWILTGVAGGGAFLLSLIIGLLSDVTAGALFLRAFISGLFFAVLINLARLVISQFLPELLEPMESEEEDLGGEEREPAIPESRGDRVNIVLGEEEEIPLEAPPSGVAASLGDDFQEQGLEALTAEGSDSGNSSLSAEPADEAEEPEELEEVVQAPMDSASAKGVIPDIAPFAEQFTGSSQVESIDGGGGKAPVSAEVLGSMHDTEEMARAVHTILQKDQEG